MAIKKKYLAYLEDTRKHHIEIEKVVKSSMKKAIATSYRKSVAVTFVEGNKIVKVSPKGRRAVVGSIKNHRRKVKVGAKTRLSKK